eukprot:359952-Chlamydomonas_euryale.AAC.2
MGDLRGGAGLDQRGKAEGQHWGPEGEGEEGNTGFTTPGFVLSGEHGFSLGNMRSLCGAWILSGEHGFSVGT